MTTLIRLAGLLALAWALHAGAAVPADHPLERADPNSRLAHEQLLEKARRGRIDLYFEGDSITRRWGGTDYPQFLDNWRKNFFGWNAADFGWGGDTTQNVLWRLHHGELDGVNPKVIVLLIGTNNVGRAPGPKVADDVPHGIKAILDLCRQKAPRATIVLTAIFPRNDSPAANPVIREINAQIAKFADGKTVRWLDINGELADPDGQLHEGISVDKLHLSVKGYQIWADALKPVLTELLGPPAKTDLAPPPTGDPSAKK
jgi:lysophospholipase L1-like esterase